MVSQSHSLNLSEEPLIFPPVLRDAHQPEPERKIKRLTPSARREIELKNHARKLADLSPIKIKVRKCISCGKLFESAGNRNCGCHSRKSGFIAGREIL